MTTLSEDAGKLLAAVRALIPSHGSVLEAKVVEEAEARGITARATRAALLLLACGETETERRNGQMWIRWRRKEG